MSRAATEREVESSKQACADTTNSKKAHMMPRRTARKSDTFRITLVREFPGIYSYQYLGESIDNVFDASPDAKHVAVHFQSIEQANIGMLENSHYDLGKAWFPALTNTEPCAHLWAALEPIDLILFRA